MADVRRMFPDRYQTVNSSRTTHTVYRSFDLSVALSVFFLSRLQRIQLAGNHLNNIPAWLGNLGNLKEVYLNSLDITTFGDFTQYNFSNVPVIDLRHQPYLHCDQQICWLKRAQIV